MIENVPSMATVTGKPQVSEIPSRTNSPSTGKRSRMGCAAVAALVRMRLPAMVAATSQARTATPWVEERHATVAQRGSAPGIRAVSGAVDRVAARGIGSLPVDIRILGVVEAVAGGADFRSELATAGGFAMLALEANTPVSADRLAEGLWGESPPASAHKMVQAYVPSCARRSGTPT